MFGAGGSGTPASTGAKFSVSGDILTLTSSIVQDNVLDMDGGKWEPSMKQPKWWL